MSRPRFVKAELMKDGSVILTDNDGEEFHVEMRTDQAWPMLSRRTRQFEMRETLEKVRKRDEQNKPPDPPQRFTLTTVK